MDRDISWMIFQLQSALLTEPVSLEVMAECSEWLQPKQYYEVVVERNVESYCGYPSCSNKIDYVTKGSKECVDVKMDQNDVATHTERCEYCSKKCYLASVGFIKSLDILPAAGRAIAKNFTASAASKNVAELLDTMSSISLNKDSEEEITYSSPTSKYYPSKNEEMANRQPPVCTKPAVVVPPVIRKIALPTPPNIGDREGIGKNNTLNGVASKTTVEEVEKVVEKDTVGVADSKPEPLANVKTEVRKVETPDTDINNASRPKIPSYDTQTIRKTDAVASTPTKSGIDVSTPSPKSTTADVSHVFDRGSEVFRGSKRKIGVLPSPPSTVSVGSTVVSLGSVPNNIPKLDTAKLLQTQGNAGQGVVGTASPESKTPASISGSTYHAPLDSNKEKSAADMWIQEACCIPLDPSMQSSPRGSAPDSSSGNDTGSGRVRGTYYGSNLPNHDGTTGRARRYLNKDSVITSTARGNKKHITNSINHATEAKQLANLIEKSGSGVRKSSNMFIAKDVPKPFDKVKEMGVGISHVNSQSKTAHLYLKSNILEKNTDYDIQQKSVSKVVGGITGGVAVTSLPPRLADADIISEKKIEAPGSVLNELRNKQQKMVTENKTVSNTEAPKYKRLVPKPRPGAAATPKPAKTVHIEDKVDYDDEIVTKRSIITGDGNGLLTIDSFDRDYRNNDADDEAMATAAARTSKSTVSQEDKDIWKEIFGKEYTSDDEDDDELWVEEMDDDEDGQTTSDDEPHEDNSEVVTLKVIRTKDNEPVGDVTKRVVMAPPPPGSVAQKKKPVRAKGHNNPFTILWTMLDDLLGHNGSVLQSLIDCEKHVDSVQNAYLADKELENEDGHEPFSEEDTREYKRVFPPQWFPKGSSPVEASPANVAKSTSVQRSVFLTTMVERGMGSAEKTLDIISDVTALDARQLQLYYRKKAFLTGALLVFNSKDPSVVAGDWAEKLSKMMSSYSSFEWSMLGVLLVDAIFRSMGLISNTVNNVGESDSSANGGDASAGDTTEVPYLPVFATSANVDGMWEKKLQHAFHLLITRYNTSVDEKKAEISQSSLSLIRKVDLPYRELHNRELLHLRCYFNGA